MRKSTFTPDRILQALRQAETATVAEAQRAWAAYEAVPLWLVEVDIGQAVALATELGLYAYDGYLFGLARSRRLPLLTLDGKLGRAARAIGVELVEIEP